MREVLLTWSIILECSIVLHINRRRRRSDLGQNMRTQTIASLMPLENMIMEQGPMARFTGRYQSLKPASVLDGIRLINEKLHRINSIKKNKPIPTIFRLSQNYPNPFNPSTTIRFSLPEQSQLKINIYNMLGELVKTLADGNYDAGYHKLTLNVVDLPSGAYIYRIESSEFIQVKKMLFIK